MFLGYEMDRGTTAVPGKQGDFTGTLPLGAG